MNIVSKLTLRHLVENKRRTVVTVLGIATSTALITAILVGIFSFFKFFGYITIQGNGDAPAVFEDLTKEQVDHLKNDSRISAVGIINGDSQNLGIMLEGDGPLSKRIGNIMDMDQVSYKQMVQAKYDGEFPGAPGEIAVEEKFLKDNGLECKIGDTIKFQRGNRYSYDENGEIVYWGGNYRSEEAFEKLSDEEYTITAILHGNRPTKSYDVLGVSQETFFDKNVVRITLKKCDHTALKQLKEIISDYGIRKYNIDEEYMLSVFAFEKSDGTMKALISMMVIALGIVVATSVILIYNAFGMSLAERMRYLGMLASVGATGRQKRSSVYFEGFILGLIGIPLGILLGMAGTFVTLTVLGRKILEADIFVDATGMRGTIPLVVSPLVILVIVLLAAVTIFISAVVPAHKASKVMPIDALRQADTIRVRGKKLKINPIIRMIFGYEGEIAYKNIKRNGIKGTVITFTIAVSVIMFLSINYFCDSIRRANYYDVEYPYQIVASCSYSEKESLREELSQMKDIKSFAGVDFVAFNYRASRYNPVVANKDILNPDFLTDNYKKLFDDFSSIDVVVMEDADFRALLEKNKVSADKYFEGDLKGALLNNVFHEKHEKAVFNEKIIGQKVFYNKQQGNPPAVEIADMISFDEDEKVFKMTQKGSVSIYVPESVYYKKAAENIQEDLLSYTFNIETDNHEELCARIYELFETKGYHNYYCSDMTGVLESMNTITLMINTVMYGFTILLTLIAIANIVNTISTGVLLRRKEFAMYKSVGMTGKGFKKMIFLETLLYGLRALILGIPVAIFLSYIMYAKLGSKLLSFDLNYIMYAAVIAVVFAVVGLSMLLSVNKLKDESIIEALKIDAV